MQVECLSSDVSIHLMIKDSNLDDTGGWMVNGHYPVSFSDFNPSNRSSASHSLIV